ncbi:protein kinase [Streptomyces sp. ISL-112]|uniref:protein kinase domain-containing protein n=1 Tax=unclassified Streptomyces TaxID=2593676 RepID=UPI001BE5F64C|nr:MULTISPECIES: protein kinase [unclassified Streptomyces]MBT2424142.1 protein kinase [Streptomyces sp. ISL-112]MBT2460961.1 protein kinase [Streptomyces sp. ISL-63]
MPPLPGAGAHPEAEFPEYAGTYRLEACLGSGGMGVVHLARSASGLQLAVKVVHRPYAADPEFRARFRQEVAAARRVSGAFTAPVVDADPDAERPWMATLYVPGPTLAEQVKRNGPLAPAELRRLTAGLAEALRDIHRAGVIHRDLKPSNVLLSDAGPKVIDFGISRPYDSDLRTETGKLIGSPPYMAPEQFQRPREVGPAADVFALGAVLVHAATGRGPFDSDSPYIVAYQVVHDEADLSGVPEDLAELVGRCLAKDPAERPTPDEVMAALRPPSYEAAAFIPAPRRPAASTVAVEAGEREGAEDATHVRGAAVPARRWRPARGRLVLAAALLLLVAGAGAGGFALWGGGGGSPAQAPERAAEGKGAGAVAFSPWSTTLRTGGRATPVCSSAGAGAALYCAVAGTGTVRIHPASGRVVWSDRNTALRDASAPIVSGGVVLSAGPDGKLRAYDPVKGVLVRETSLSASPGSAFPAGSTLLAVADGGTVTALDGASGVERWERPLTGHTRPDFGLYDEASGLAYAFEHASTGTSTLVTAVDAASGRAAWQRRLEGVLTPVATAGAGQLVLTEMNADMQTVGLVRYAPGKREAARIALPFRLDEPQVVMGGDAAYLLGRGGSLLAVDTGAGGGKAELWRLETGVGRGSAPVLGEGGHLYFSAADGRLLAVDTERGALVGQTRARLSGGRLTYASDLPAPVTAGRVVVGTAPDGSVFAVDGLEPGGW